MARKYYKRRYYRRKGRWSANIKTVQSGQITTPANASFFNATTLCENPAQVDNTVSQQYTVKNIELSYEIDIPQGQGHNVEALTAYIMFVPQGMTITETYPNTHPEYIMTYRYIGSPVTDNTTTSTGRLPAKIKTRMARRLQTGDSVVLLITGLNESTNDQTINFTGIVRWWTKAN